METLITMPGWVYTTTIIIGAVLVVHGMWTAFSGRLEQVGYTVEIRRLIWLARGLRTFLFGLGMVGFGLGAIYGATWLVAASIAIALEELYESSMALAFLERIEENERTLEEPDGQVDIFGVDTSYRPLPQWACEEERDRFRANSVEQFGLLSPI